MKKRGAWVAQWVVSNFGSGHDLVVREFECHIRLCADSSEPEACFGFCVSLSLSLCLSHTYALSLSVSKIKINIKKEIFFE